MKLLCALLAAILLAFYFPLLTRQADYFQSDLTYYFEPFSNFIADSYRHLKLPLWNPYLYCGMSQIAVPSPGAFYPGTLLFVLMPFSQALAAYMLVHQFIGGLGAFLLVFGMGWGTFAALVAGFAMALCGYMFSLQYNYTLIASAVWLPLLVHCIRRISGRVKRANIGRMLAASLCMAMMVAAGRPEISIPAALIVVAYILASAVATYAQDRVLRPVLMTTCWRLMALVCGGILAMPVLLPALEWVKLSPRQHGLELQWVLMWSANWYDCLGMVLAQPLGDLTYLGNKFLNMAASRPNSVPYVTSTYVGPIIFTLAIWGLGDRHWKWKWFVVCLFVGGLLMAMGNYTPIAPFVSKLSPMFSSFRYPVKMMIFPMMAAILLAARGTMQAMSREVRGSALVCAISLWTLVTVIGAVFVIAHNLVHVVEAFPWMKNQPINVEVMLQAQHLFGHSLLVAGGLGLLTCGNYILFSTGRLTSNLFGGLLVATTCLTIVAPAFSFQHKTTVADFYSRPDELANFVRGATKGVGNQRFGSRVLCLAFDPLTPGSTFLQDQKIDFQHGFYLFARQLMLPNTNIDFGVPYSFGYEAAEMGQFKQLFSAALSQSSQNRLHSKEEMFDAPMARFAYLTSAAVTFTQSFQHFESNKIPMLDSNYFELLKDDPKFNVRIFRVKNTLPRVYFARNVKWNAQWQDFYETMEDADDESMPQDTYVWGDAPQPGVDGSPTQSNETITFVHDEDNRVSLIANASQRRLLVLTDQWYPGWELAVDGVPARLRRVNFFARGVVLEPGKHVVEFRYQPKSLFVAFGCTGVTLLFFVAAFLLAEPKRREPARGNAELAA